jgi:hypothetical protein
MKENERRREREWKKKRRERESKTREIVVLSKKTSHCICIIYASL